MNLELPQTLQARVARRPFSEGVDLLLCATGAQPGSPFAGIVAAGELTMKPVQPGMAMDATAHLSETEAQALMDGLWHCGLRPSEGTGSAGALAATQAHLNDMRRLVFETAGRKP